ncbi:MAG: extracellular solute-binding protein, partial [bacterium]
MKETSNRRNFLKTAGLAGLGLALQSLPSFPAVIKVAKIRLRLRQYYFNDYLMNSLLNFFNRQNGDIQVISSYTEPPQTWGEEIAAIDTVPDYLTRGEEYELFLAHSTELANMVDADMVEPLDDCFAKGSLKTEDFHISRYDSVLASTTYRGKIWAVPIVADPYTLFCNMNIFRKAGVEFPVTTWDETLAAARKMVMDTDGDGQTNIFGFSQCSFQFPLQILTHGLPLVDVKNKRVTFDSDAGVEALYLYSQLKRCSPPHVEFEREDMGMKISVTSNAFGRYKNIDHRIGPLPQGVARANSYGDSDGALVVGIRKNKKEITDAG